ncbi:MAG: transketolase [Defluviitaleaceae bacterium]|nr:transketolase [Defluviitaleaceae bacterium]
MLTPENITKTDQQAINTIRVLSAEMVQKANSGHPGTPLGAAPAAYALWAGIMNHNPLNPRWENRDRFVLSAGHASALLYSLLHLFGYGLTIKDLQQFRQKGSLTPGHPEFGHTAGVEITSGPLGQGFANAVGFAWAEKFLSTRFNKPDLELVDHYTYVLCGDGCLMEGITSEAASLAGTLKLGKLVVLYDSNKITIEGSTDLAFTEKTAKRFESYDWHVQTVEDGNDVAAILTAISAAKAETDRPSFIEIKTQIGYGAPNKQGKPAAHGEPLGAEEIKLMKENLGHPAEAFVVSTEVKELFAKFAADGAKKNQEWQMLLSRYEKAYRDDYDEWESWNHTEVAPFKFASKMASNEYWHYTDSTATRLSSEIVLNKITDSLPNLIGGSADLAPSTKAVMKEHSYYSPENTGGSNLRFGVREHAMAAIANGMSVHGRLRPYVAGFFVFSDYMKHSMRLSALMNQPVIYIMTHDSIGVGEDGPTHQPVEHLAALRSIPNFTVIRPCDTRETAAAWAIAITRTTSPTALVLTRQNLPLLPGSGKNALNGGYILTDSINPATNLPDIILIASGSEVHLMTQAQEELQKEGIFARVVSIPSFEIFEEQDSAYKQSVLPSEVRIRLAAEAGTSFGWHKYIGLDGDIIAIDHFGASAPAELLFEEYGFTTENVVERAKVLLKK